MTIAPDYDLVDICRGCTFAINTIINWLRLSVIRLRGLTVYWITASLDAHVRRTTPAYSDNNDAAFRDWLEDKREDIYYGQAKSRAAWRDKQVA